MRVRYLCFPVEVQITQEIDEIHALAVDQHRQQRILGINPIAVVFRFSTAHDFGWKITFTMKNRKII